MINFIVKYLVFLFFSIFSSIVFAQSNQTLDQFYQSTQSMQADFEQTIRNTQGKILESSLGSLILSRPDKFILQYTTPAEQKYISNGKTIWIYDVELEQVSIKNIDEGIGDSPALLLSSHTNVYNHYRVTDIKKKQPDGLSWVQLQAKKTEMTFEKVILAFKNTVLMKMTMYDSFGQITELKFSKVLVNKPFANRQFNFVPPEEVDVIGSVSAQ